MIEKRKLATMSVTVLTIAALLAGCGAQQGANKMPVAVNTYKVTAEDTPVTAEYSGVVVATDKVPVQPKVSGRVVEKFVQGGQDVTQGSSVSTAALMTRPWLRPRLPRPSLKPTWPISS